MTGTITVDSQPDVGPSLQFESDNEQLDEPEIFLDGALVLVGCGKDKRDPTDPTDLHVAAVGPDEEFRNGTGPAWEAQDLYTHWYFEAKADFGRRVGAWAGDIGERTPGWAILSAEHGILFPWEKVKHYNTTMDDLGGDETNPDHHVTNKYNRRRPDGREIVTERDKWAASVAYGLARWEAMFRERGVGFGSGRANSLLVLAGQDYIDPLRERGVFEYGIAKMTKPGGGGRLPGTRPRFLFEEIPAGGNGEQGSWLHNATDVIDDYRGGKTEQQTLVSDGGQQTET